MKFRPIILFLLTLLAACSAGGAEIEIKDAWVRPAEAGMNTAVYFIIDNPGEQDRLIATQSTSANAVETHRSHIDAVGVAHMEKLESVNIPAHDQLVFEPGGLHIMLLELSRELVPGEEIQLRLHFAGQGEVTIDVPVETP